MRAKNFTLAAFFVLGALPFSGRGQTNPADQIIGKAPDLTVRIILTFRGEEIKARMISAYDEAGSYDQDNMPSQFGKGAIIRFVVIENATKERADKNNYLFDISSEDAAVKPFYVYTGPGSRASAAPSTKPGPPAADQITSIYEDVPLKDAGQKYSIKITRYDSMDEKLAGEKGKVIFEYSARTRHRFYFGLNAGVFLPISYYAKTYGLFYGNPSASSEDVRPIIHQRKYWNPQAIVFLSYYPGGFEPEQNKGRFQINAGTELSSSIMASLYLGFGYATQYCSINVFCGYFTEQVLPDNYSKNQTIQNKNIDSVPLIDQGRLCVGLTIAVPFSIAGVFGKLIGL